ncbi:MAG: cellulose biosynthesis cyclic di-GMP-binding regulatory protein BcsB, partial [Pseudomonas sp.]|nr:cellulose biosynthesis cyclic di-GMP-binding regulatory protein BcsB [Pseudomonas sp.]
MTVLHSGSATARTFFALSALLASLAAVPASAEQEAPAVGASAETAETVFEPNYNRTLKQLGVNYTMNLRGIEGSDGVSFDVRADQVVTDARLNLQYSYSPALIPELSQLNVLVNDQVAASLALPKESAGSLQQQSVQIPAHLITEFNRLTLQLIGHYTMQCEDPLHSSLWAKVSNGSQLQIQTTPLALADDLALLPLPFFDLRDSSLLELPFVFAGEQDERTLEAAGAVASWFGALASYRGARFPVSIYELPAKGNAIVLLSGERTISGLAAQAVESPTLSVQTNPNDPYGKVLILAGRDSEQLKQAALALVSGSRALSGEQARITELTALQPRKPYDAPNWLPSDR